MQSSNVQNISFSTRRGVTLSQASRTKLGVRKQHIFEALNFQSWENQELRKTNSMLKTYKLVLGIIPENSSSKKI